jgi:ubiquinone/menaquinone biosynthesis C-methylase UbiE
MTIATCSPGSVTLLDARAGYRKAATIYDGWHWQEFWRRNELPIVRDWLVSLDLGVVLDVGTGTGLYRAAIGDAGHVAVGVDVSAEMLQVQRAGYPLASVVLGSAEALPFRSSSFSHVLSTRLLTHVPVLSRVFSEFRRVVRPGGQIFIADLHPEHPYSKMTIKARNRKISIQIVKHSVDELMNSLYSSGLQVIDFRNYTLDQISWKPPEGGFKNIYRDPVRPIFYTALLQRR